MTKQEEAHLPAWLRWTGVVFIAWWAFDFALKSITLGFTRYNWLWFCSVSLILLGIGLAFESPTLLNAFLGLAVVFQIHWLIDFAIVAFANGQEYSSFVSTYVFKPGYPWYEFVNAMRHLFMLPFGFLGCMLLRKPSRRAVPVGAAFGVALMGLSFAVTNPADNVNCVFASCIPLLDFIGGTPFYGIVYTVIVALIGVAGILLVNWGVGRLERLHGKEWERNRKEKLWMFGFLLTFSCVLLVQGIRIYLAVQSAS